MYFALEYYGFEWNYTDEYMSHLDFNGQNFIGINLTKTFYYITNIAILENYDSERAPCGSPLGLSQCPRNFRIDGRRQNPRVHP